MDDTFYAGFHRGTPGQGRSQPRALYEATLTRQSGPWEAALAFAETIPDSEKAQGQVILFRPKDGAIFIYACSTSYVPEHTKTITVPEKVTRRLAG
jgi:hypothetical protein